MRQTYSLITKANTASRGFHNPTRPHPAMGMLPNAAPLLRILSLSISALALGVALPASLGLDKSYAQGGSTLGFGGAGTGGGDSIDGAGGDGGSGRTGYSESGGGGGAGVTGGAGGAGSAGQPGGAGGDAAHPDGGVGAVGLNAGGGGGGAHGYYGSALGLSGPVAGGAGGKGGTPTGANASGGGGGAGGYGAVLTDVSGSNEISSSVTGGKGGDGGDGAPMVGNGGGGGSGGVGLVLDLANASQTVIGADVTGGQGGDGGLSAMGGHGAGGLGGDGLLLQAANVDASIVVNSGAAIAGGNGGYDAISTVSGGAGVERVGNGGVVKLDIAGTVKGGDGGQQNYANAGIIGSDLDITLRSGALVAGGLYGDFLGQPTPGNASSLFLTGTNTLRFDAAIADSADVLKGRIYDNGTLILDDAASAPSSSLVLSNALAVTNLVKESSGSVTLTGLTNNIGAIDIASGTLAISDSRNLNAYANIFGEQTALTLGGGTLSLLQDIDLSSSILLRDATGSRITVAAGRTANLSGAITGSGGVTLAEGGGLILMSFDPVGGTIILSGANSQTGGTTIDSGTVILAGAGTLGAADNTTTVNGGTLDLGTTSQTQAALVQNGGVVKNGDMTVTDYTLTGGMLARDASVTASDAFDVSDGHVAGALHGTGALTKTGDETVILSGDNDYSGGTTIESGALRLGLGGTTGSITGDIVNNGVLIIDRSDAVDFTNAVSGTGFLAIIGGGATTLADVNSYSGGTIINAGASAIGTAASFGSGALFNNGAVTIAQAQDGVLVNELEGSGSFVKTGAGDMDMTGGGGFSGSVGVQQGGVSVNADYSQANFMVGDGARLSGAGSVGGLTVAGGAELATGDDGVGTLTVANNLVQQSGSLWSVQLGSAGQGDAVHVGGSATIIDGAVLDVTNASGGRYALGRAYTVLSAEGGVTGRYTLTGDTNLSMFYDLTADYSNDAVVLKTQQIRAFTDIDGLNRNQNAAAEALQSMEDANALHDAVGYLNDANEAKNAYSQLAGDIHASAQSMAIEDGRFVREAALNRLRNGAEDANQNGLTWWSRGFGSKGRFDGTASDSASDLTRSIGGAFAGVDTAVGEGWRVGALAGYSYSNFSTRWVDSEAQAKGYHVGLYGGGQAGFLDVRLGASFSWQKLDTSRGIGFAGYSDALSASYDSQVTQLFGEVGHRFDVKDVALEPFANLAYVHLHTDGFTEKGGAAALHGDASNADTLFTTIGLRASTAISADGATRLYGSAGWRYAYNDLTPSTALNFVSGGDGFSAAGVPIARNVATLELGVDRKVTNNLSFGVSYVGQLSGRTQDHGAKATLELKF